MNKFFSNGFVPRIIALILMFAAFLSGVVVLWLAVIPFSVWAALALKKRGSGFLALIWLGIAVGSFVNFLLKL